MKWAEVSHLEAQDLSHRCAAQGKPTACTIKHYGLVIYGKLTYFVVSSCRFYRTNTLAYYGVRTLRICNVFHSAGAVFTTLIFSITYK